MVLLSRCQLTRATIEAVHTSFLTEMAGRSLTPKSPEWRYTCDYFSFLFLFAFRTSDIGHEPYHYFTPLRVYMKGYSG